MSRGVPSMEAARDGRERTDEAGRFGPWRVTGTLGEGGMGVVYRVVHEGDGRTAALKTVRGVETALLRGMRREIRALARLDHPSVVRILDVGLSDAVPWYAMELLEGCTLRELLAAGEGGESHAVTVTAEVAPSKETTGPVIAASRHPRSAPSPARRDELLRVFPPLCEALAFLHGEGVVHLDLKPDNVFLAQGGRVVLMDFGLATRSSAGQGRESLDFANRGAGTALYISPEQLRGDPVDARADLYALGVMLHEVVAGRTPFEGSHAAAVVFAHLQTAPAPLSDLAPDVPEPLVRLVLALLAKRADERPGYAADVGRSLSQVLHEPAAPRPRAPRPYLYRPAMVGRAAAVASLRASLERVERGGTELVLVAGESGVGKTRLALEVARAAHGKGLSTHLGECPALAPGEVAGALLAPFAEIFHQAADRCVELGAGETERLFGANLRVLLPHAPVLGSVPGIADAPEPESLPARATRARLIRTFLQMLTALSRATPVLLLVDDIHWADDATLGVIEAIARASWEGDAGLLVVTTYRSDESSPRIRDLAALAERDEGTRVRSLQVGRLDEVSARAMVDGMLGATELPPPLVARVTQEGEGNPFFIAEYLRAAVREGVLVRTEGRWRADDVDGRLFASLPPPRAIIDLVARRLAHLSPGVRAVAEAAAVLGREFDPRPIAAMLGRAENDVLDAVLELFATQMAEPLDDGRARFAHARLHEFTYGGLDAPERRRLHGAAGRALADGPRRAGLAATLAQHLRQGPAPHEALPHLEEAAFEALAAGDHRGAKLLFEEFEALAPTAPEPLSVERRARVARGLGDACFFLGELSSAADHGRRALRELGHPLPASALGALVALVREGLVRLAAPRVDALRASRLEDAALAAQRIGEAAYYSLDAPQLITGSLLATVFAARAGHGVKVAKASAMLGVVLASLKLPKAAARWGDDAIERARGAADRNSLCFTLYARSVGFCTMGELRPARELGVEALAAAEALGDPHEIATSAACIGNAEYFLGEFVPSAERFARLREGALRAGLSQLATWGLYAQSRALVHVGRLEEALDLARRASAELEGVGDEASTQIVLGLLASAQVGLGDEDGARQSLAQLRVRARHAPGAIFAVAPGYAAACSAALALHRAGDRAALEIAREAAGWLSRVAWGNAVAESSAALCSGRVALASGRRPAADRLLRRAAHLAAARGMRLDEGLALGWRSEPSERARGLALLRDIGAEREARTIEEAS
jgi:serine/threonine protein kinase